MIMIINKILTFVYFCANPLNTAKYFVYLDISICEKFVVLYNKIVIKLTQEDYYG